jgi:hypothetical protein
MSEQLAVIQNVTPRKNLPGSAYAEAVIDDEFIEVINKYVNKIDDRYDQFVAAGTAHSNQIDYLTFSVEAILLERFCYQFGHINFRDVRQELARKDDTECLAPFVKSAQANFLANLALEAKRWPERPESH